jgi:putative ABC transport system permease protein
MILLTESAGDPAQLAAPIREIVRRIDADQLVFDVHTMEEFFQLSTVGLMNTIIGMVAAMGLMGLGLSIVGLYGLVAYAANRRTREIGIRMALGADRGSVLRMVLGRGVMLAFAGLIAGLVASVAVGHLLERAFPGGEPANEKDFTALIIVGLVVLAVTALSAYIPARRASRVNPMDALRYE